MKKMGVLFIFLGLFTLVFMGYGSEYVLSPIFDFILWVGGKPKHLVNMRLEIKDPSKPHTFRFFVDPSKSPLSYTNLIHGQINGTAQFKRYDGCEYYPKSSCNPSTGALVSSLNLSKGNVFTREGSDYYGGKIILRYIPHGVTQGYLYIDVKIP